MTIGNKLQNKRDRLQVTKGTDRCTGSSAFGSHRLRREGEARVAMNLRLISEEYRSLEGRLSVLHGQESTGNLAARRKSRNLVHPAITQDRDVTRELVSIVTADHCSLSREDACARKCCAIRDCRKGSTSLASALLARRENSVCLARRRC